VQSARERLPREMEILKRINSAVQANAALPTLLRIFQTSGSVFMLFREVSVCDLATLVELGITTGDENTVRWLAACLVSAIHTLHSEHHTLYRNFCTENSTLLENGYALLSDFRCAKRDDGNCFTFCGPVSGVAPETLRGDPHSPASDMWSVGALLFELATGESPWGASDAEDTIILKRIAAHTAGELEMPEVTPELLQLCNGLLDPEPTKRPTSAQVMDHPWFAEVPWERIYRGEVTSQLGEVAREQLSVRLDEGSGKELQEDELPLGMDDSWLNDLLGSVSH